MFTYRSIMKCGVAFFSPLIILILFTAVAATVKPAYPADESIDVTCYKGNTEEGNQVGNVTVTNPTDAGQACNSTYYDCDGKCIGCYYDQNQGKTFCFNNAGDNVAK